MKTTLALGLGCDRGTPYATVAEVIDQALFALGASWADVKALASIDLKADEEAMHELMRARQMPIRFFSAAQLADVPVPNPSETVRKYTGTPSVSEAAALLVAGQGIQHATPLMTSDLLKPAPMSALLIEKLKLRGPDGRNATVSVARIQHAPSGDVVPPHATHG
ncbi:MAG: cobalamin biosynthesis protein [Lautropia sp.]|nr:cobalamin biosynthesis protein [Lautropia sp.]